MLLIGGDGGRSGVPRHLEHLLRACAGQARFVVLSEPDRGGYAALRQGAVRHICLADLASRPRPWRMIRTGRWLARLIRREAPDLVWAHARMGVLLLHLLILAQALRGRLWRPGAEEGPCPALAITYHGLPFGPGHPAPLSRAALWLERLALRHGPPRCLIFLSPEARAGFRAAVGAEVCARHRLECLANSSTVGPLPEREAPQEGAAALRQVLVTGRLSRQKNLARALRIFAALPGSYRIRFCGEGTDSHAFRRLARRVLGDAALRRVEMLGPVEDLRPLYAEADVFLLTSRYEGQPIAALEAFEAGLPLVLPDLPECRAMAAAHPHAALLTGAIGAEDPAEDALRLVHLAEGQVRGGAARRAAIHAAWRYHAGFARWSQQMAALLQSLLPSAATDSGTAPPPPRARDPGQVLPFPLGRKPPQDAAPKSGS